MNDMLYLASDSTRSYTTTAAVANTLGFQGVKDGRNLRKDTANSTPGVAIINTTLERSEVVGGVTYHIYVITFGHQYRSSDGKDVVEMKATLTVRVPQAVIANTDIKAFAEAFIMLLLLNGTTGEAGAFSSSKPSQLEQVMLGSI